MLQFCEKRALAHHIQCVPATESDALAALGVLDSGSYPSASVFGWLKGMWAWNHGALSSTVAASQPKQAPTRGTQEYQKATLRRALRSEGLGQAFQVTGLYLLVAP